MGVYSGIIPTITIKKTRIINKMKKSEDYHIVNYMEELVGQTLMGLVSKMPKKRRPSDRRKADIKALALNRLWPMYVTTSRGKRFVERDIVSDKIDRDVNRELMAALDRVNSNPR